MSTQDFDIVVIGAGMAGATAAAFLSADKRVALLEAEDVAGYHTTGRSAAIWILNYGPPDVRILTRMSRSFYEAPGPPDFPTWGSSGGVPSFSWRPRRNAPDLEAALASGEGLRAASVQEAQDLIPALRPRLSRWRRDRGRRLRHGCRGDPPGLSAHAHRQRRRYRPAPPSRRDRASRGAVGD